MHTYIPYIHTYIHTSRQDSTYVRTYVNNNNPKRTRSSRPAPFALGCPPHGNGVAFDSFPHTSGPSGPARSRVGLRVSMMAWHFFFGRWWCMSVARRVSPVRNGYLCVCVCVCLFFLFFSCPPPSPTHPFLAHVSHTYIWKPG